MKFDLLFEELIKDYSEDNTNVKAIFVFGRMNPPTAGHEMLINHAAKVAEAENRELFIFLSRKTNNTDNPLSFDDKAELLDFVFPNIKIVNDDKAINPVQAGYWLRDHGYKDVKIVAGSDRKPEFEVLFNKYKEHRDESGELTDKSFNFTKFKVETVGAIRDPDKGGTAGISASKARQLADEGNIKGFSEVLPAEAPYEDIVIPMLNKIRKAHSLPAVSDNEE